MKKFYSKLIFLGLLTSIYSCSAIAQENKAYEFVRTDIRANGCRYDNYQLAIFGLCGCWYDNNRFVALQEKQTGSNAETRWGLYYIDITQRPIMRIEIDLSSIELSERIRSVSCQENMILFNLPGSDRSTTKTYSVKIMGKPELISEMRGSAVNLKGRYVAGSNLRIHEETIEKTGDCNVKYLKPGFKSICLDNSDYLSWPLEKFIISEYKWSEKTGSRNENGEYKMIPNPEKPLLNTGQPSEAAIFLRDLHGKIIADLSNDPNYDTPRAAFSHFNFTISPDEQYVYAGCRKKETTSIKYKIDPRRLLGDRLARGLDRVCRYRLDGRKNLWEEIFDFDPGYLVSAQIEKLSVNEKGDLYFTISGTSKPEFLGIWKYDAASKSLNKLTHPKSLMEHNDSWPFPSPDEARFAFLRIRSHRKGIINDLFIGQLIKTAR